MSGIEDQIREASDMMSLILVFVTILFGVRYPQIQDDLAEEVPAGEAARRRHRAKLRRSLMVNALPLLLVAGISTFLFVPLSLQIGEHYTMSLNDFNLVVSAFVFLTSLIAILFAWSLILAGKLVNRMTKSL